MTDLQLQIQETINKIIQLDKVRTRLSSTARERELVEKEISIQNKKISAGLRDLEKLDGLGTRGIFYHILGSKEEQLEKERQEFLEANLKYEDALNRKKILEYEINLLNAKLGSQDQLKTHLDKLKQLREKEIIDEDPALREQLLEISHALEKQYRIKKELEEAIEIGNLCHNLTSQVIGHLQRVSNWGHWGSKKQHRQRFRLKQEAIDRARNIAFQVRHHLRVFDDELRDVGRSLSFDLDYDVLNNFTNFFFDNLITDWIFQQKLTKALSSVGKTKVELERVLNSLDFESKKAIQIIHDLKTKRESIIIS